jgi:hypothetical protein
MVCNFTTMILADLLLMVANLGAGYTSSQKLARKFTIMVLANLVLVDNEHIKKILKQTMMCNLTLVGIQLDNIGYAT